jgi:hypothetical protein
LLTYLDVVVAVVIRRCGRCGHPYGH